MRRRSIRASLLVVAAVCAALLPGEGAVADTVSIRSWIGECRAQLYPIMYGGWCDGNGPDSYQATVTCYGSGHYYGPRRWAGDRRGSYAVCPSGITAVNGAMLLQPA
jgi:hypothetical protein